MEDSSVESAGPQVFDITGPFTSAPARFRSPASQYPRASAQFSDLLYATFLGGGNSEAGERIAVDRAGRAYVTGPTWSTDFPATPGAFDASYNGFRDVFVARLNPAGTTLEYATFLGRGANDSGHGIAVDGDGRAYITGEAEGPGFPVTPGAIDASYNGDTDAFVARLSAAGTALEYATFLGGSSWDEGDGIAADAAGRVYVTGWTLSANFPATPDAFGTSYNGNTDGFLVRLNSAGTALEYAAFLGGGATDYGLDIAVDNAGRAYVTGLTYSVDFPATSGAFGSIHNGDADAFVARVNPAGTALEYASFLGGGGHDRADGIDVDWTDRAYVTGSTGSSDFPITADVFDSSYNGEVDAFVARVNATGTALEYATFVGGGDDDRGGDIAVDALGRAYIAGGTGSADFPTTPSAFGSSYGGGESDVFVVLLSTDATLLEYSTFLGGGDEDQGWGGGVAVDWAGRIYVTGWTQSADFPTTPGAFDTSYNGDRDAFVAKLAVGMEHKISLPLILRMRLSSVDG